MRAPGGSRRVSAEPRSAELLAGIVDEARVHGARVGRRLEVGALAVPDLGGALVGVLRHGARPVPDLLVIADVALHGLRIELSEILGADLGVDLLDRRVL